jgi:hypothetical protein
MKRWSPWIGTVIVLAIFGAAARNHMKSVAREKREIVYRSVLQKYSAELALRSRRPEVESYLRARGADFSWIYTAFGGRRKSQYADVVKIGEESAPWYCSDAYVYIAFEFSGAEDYKQSDSDVLERIEIFRPYSGCL